MKKKIYQPKIYKYKGRVMLAVPDGMRLKKWRHNMQIYLAGTNCAYIFHSRHVKIWEDEPIPDFPNTKYVMVKDQTERSDPVMLALCCYAMKRACEKDHPKKWVRDVMFHYLSNLIGESYKDEAKYLRERARKLTKLSKTYTAKMDHGWELKELRKAGLVK